jgi:hypothetical protein
VIEWLQLVSSGQPDPEEPPGGTHNWRDSVINGHPWTLPLPDLRIRRLQVRFLPSAPDRPSSEGCLGRMLDPRDDPTPGEAAAMLGTLGTGSRLCRSAPDPQDDIRRRIQVGTGTFASLCGSMRILACLSGWARASKAASTPPSPTVPVTIGGALNLPSASRWRVSQNSRGE